MDLSLIYLTLFKTIIQNSAKWYMNSPQFCSTSRNLRDPPGWVWTWCTLHSRVCESETGPQPYRHTEFSTDPCHTDSKDLYSSLVCVTLQSSLFVQCRESVKWLHILLTSTWTVKIQCDRDECLLRACSPIILFISPCENSDDRVYINVYLSVQETTARTNVTTWHIIRQVHSCGTFHLLYVNVNVRCPPHAL